MTKKGYKQTEEHKRKRSDSLKGHFVSKETKKKISLKRKGKKHSKITKQKIKGRVPINKGKTKENYLPLKVVSEKMKIARKKKFWNSPNYKHSVETKKKMKQNHTDVSDKNNPNWRGGCFEPYTIDWKETLKKSIRERDKYICKLCFIHQDYLEEKLHVHHIDYNKKNCNPDNLISLCRKCHAKTSWNRERWIKFFGEIKNG